jgi:hypothetical protein
MRGFKEKAFSERLGAAAEARKAQLEDLGAKIAMGGCRCGRRLGIEAAR